MTSRKFSILGVVAIVVLAAALWLAYPRSASESKSDAFYPGLKGDLANVTAIRIFKSGDQRAVELSRGDSHWQVTERSNYPADAAKVRKLLQALAEAKPVEEKTSNPENYPALGVEDVSGATATGARIEVAGTAKPVDLIVGKAAGVKGSYVRRAGEAASWLASENIEASTTPHDWLQSAIIDIGADRVQSVTVAIAGAKPYSVAKSARTDADFTVDGLPKGKQAEAYAAGNAASALAGLTLADVRPAQEFAADKPAAHATLRTFDGLVVDLDGWAKDEKHYIAVRTAFDDALAKQFHEEAKAPESGPGDAAAEGATKPAGEAVVGAKPQEDASRLNARLKDWVYEIADYKYEAIFKPVDSILKK